MSAVVFSLPGDGSDVVAPDIEWLRGLILRGGADFWCSGCGQGWFKYPEGPELLLAFALQHGFYPEYIDRQRVCWISFSEDENSDKVSVWIGGDPIVVSTRFFVPAEVACAVVEEFCATGKRTNKVNWVRQDAVDWKYGWWDHPDVALD
jgi:Immunity protein Imm1